MSEPAPHGRAGLARFVVGTGVANGLGLLWSALVGRWLGAAGSADYFAALFVLQAVYMAGHPLNGVLARFGAVYRSEGQPRRTLALVRWLFVRAALACVAVGMVVALTFEAQVAGLHFDDRWALTLGWIGGGVALTLGLLRGALRGVGLLDALAVNFNAEALLRLLIGATLIGALAAWWASPLASPSLASLPSSGSPSSSPSLLLPALAGGESFGLAARAIAAHIAAALVAIGLAAVLLRRRLSAVPGEGASPSGLLVDGVAVRALLLGMLGLSLADAAWQNADALIAKHALADVAAGHYGAVATLTRLFAVLVQPFALLVIPLLVEAQAKGHGPGRQLGRLVGAFMLLASLAVVVLGLLPGEAMTLVFGAEFTAAAPLVLPQALGALACYLAMMLGQAFAAVGRFGFLAIHVVGLCGLVALGASVDDGAVLAAGQAAIKGVVLVALVLAWWRVGRASNRV